jgi:hypothetical protein
MVELEGEKETSSEVASTVTRPPALSPLLPETEKTTRPLEVAMGVADGGVEMGRASVVGTLVAVVREETGWTMPLDVEGAGAGDWSLRDCEPSVAGLLVWSEGLGSGSTVVELGGLSLEMVVLLWRLAMRRSEVASGAFSEWTASSAVRSWEKTPSWNLEDQRCKAEWMEESSTSARRRWNPSASGGPYDGFGCVSGRCCCCCC